MMPTQEGGEVTTMDLPQFWHISYAVPSGHSGQTFYEFAAAGSEAEARAQAAGISRRYGHANITNRQGLVATYVNGSPT
jgi:hypothetical protein